MRKFKVAYSLDGGNTWAKKPLTAHGWPVSDILAKENTEDFGYVVAFDDAEKLFDVEIPLSTLRLMLKDVEKRIGLVDGSA